MAIKTLIRPERVWVGDPVEEPGRQRPWRVSWRVNGRKRSRMFSTKRAANRYTAELLSAVDAGELWHREKLLPASMVEVEGVTVLTVGQRLTADKWTTWEDHSRKSATEFLSIVLAELVRVPLDPTDRRRGEVRRAIRYLLVPAADRAGWPVPSVDTVNWIDRNMLDIAQVTQEVHDEALRRAFITLSGRPYLPASQANIRNNGMSALMSKAVQMGHLPHSLTAVSDAAGVPSEQTMFDPDTSYISRDQYTALREAYTGVSKDAERLGIWLDLQYHCGLRPSEALAVREDWLELPEQAGGWGTIWVESAVVQPGTKWATDKNRQPTGTESGEKGRLKRRATGERREVPVPPPMVTALRDHIRDYRIGAGEPLVRTASGKVPTNLARRFRAARRTAFSADDPRHHHAVAYDLRRSSVSNQLSAGVPEMLVARNHGHDVAVMRTHYARLVSDATGLTAQAMAEVYK